MSFKFIDEGYTGLTTADAGSEDQITLYEISGIFIGQEKRGAFRIGNESTTQAANYNISASGLNANVIDDVTFSTDGTTFTATVGVSGVRPNQVSPLVRFALKLDDGDPIGVGTFLVRVDEDLI